MELFRNLFCCGEFRTKNKLEGEAHEMSLGNSNSKSLTKVVRADNLPCQINRGNNRKANGKNVEREYLGNEEENLIENVALDRGMRYKTSTKRYQSCSGIRKHWRDSSTKPILKIQSNQLHKNKGELLDQSHLIDRNFPNMTPKVTELLILKQNFNVGNHNVPKMLPKSPQSIKTKANTKVNKPSRIPGLNMPLKATSNQKSNIYIYIYYIEILVTSPSTCSKDPKLSRIPSLRPRISGGNNTADKFRNMSPIPPKSISHSENASPIVNFQKNNIFKTLKFGVSPGESKESSKLEIASSIGGCSIYSDEYFVYIYIYIIYIYIYIGYVWMPIENPPP